MSPQDPRSSPFSQVRSIMGQLRFLVPQMERLTAEVLQRAYLSGSDQIPWRTSLNWDRQELLVEREIRESGNFHVPWSVPGHGEQVLQTATLMERRQPYLLPVELARGTLSRFRNQVAIWQPAGLEIPAEVHANLRRAYQHLVLAVTQQADPANASQAAEECLRASLDGIDSLAQHFSKQVLTLRHQQTPHLATLLGGNLEGTQVDPKLNKWFTTAFNTAAVPFSWRDIERDAGHRQWEATDRLVQWCRDSGLKTIGGPLIRFAAKSLPDWLYLWEDDFELIVQNAIEYVTAVVERYQGKVHVWHVASRLNVEGFLQLNEEQRLRLAGAVLETVHRLDPGTPLLVSVDQPWGEQLVHSDVELSPLHFADMLIRAQLGVAGVGLELNYGYWPGGTLPRDLLELNRLLDQWYVQFNNSPLVIFLTVPSSGEPDPLAFGAAQPLSGLGDDGPSIQSQCAVVENLVPMLLAKQAVHGVVWNQLRDDLPHEFPHGGLFDQQGRRKPTLDFLAELRRQHLV